MANPRLRLGTFGKDETGALYGTVGGLGLGSTRVISLNDESADGRPFLRLIGDPLGAAYEIGAAFPREKDGMNYYSVILDSPLLREPMNLALFPDRDANGSYNLIWSRPEAVTVDACAQAKFGQCQRRSQFLNTSP